MVVGDLRSCIGGHRKKRRFTDIGEADQTDIRQKLQLKNDLMLLAGQPRLRKTRNLARWRGKVLIAPAASAALA